MICEMSLHGIVVLTDDRSLRIAKAEIFFYYESKYGYYGRYKSSGAQAAYDRIDTAYERIAEALEESGYYEEFDNCTMIQYYRPLKEPRLVPKRRINDDEWLPF